MISSEFFLVRSMLIVSMGVNGVVAPVVDDAGETYSQEGVFVSIAGGCDTFSALFAELVAVFEIKSWSFSVEESTILELGGGTGPPFFSKFGLLLIFEGIGGKKPSFCQDFNCFAG